MFIMYMLRSEKHPSLTYVGITSHTGFEARLEAHNTGACRFTKSKGPWVECMRVSGFPTRVAVLACRDTLQNQSIALARD